MNFGGYLEDTAIGSVVLEADKRFKTLTCGLDPNSFHDLRKKIRRYLSTFLTSSEREVSDGAISGAGWIGTRFWFYPESIEIETDYEGSFARVVKAQFTADAERSRSDFSNTSEFDSLKKVALSPHIRSSIEDLNQNYSKYASIFRELNELQAVGRLMGIMSWLYQTDHSAIDLDSLLSVALPEHKTERTRTQNLVITSVAEGNDSSGRIFGAIIVENITPILEQPIRSYFENHNQLSAFISSLIADSINTSESKYDETKFITMMHSDEKVKTLIKSKSHLEKLVLWAAEKSEAPVPSKIIARHSRLSALNTNLGRLQSQLDQLDKLMSKDAATHNRYLDKHNSMVDDYNEMRNTYNELVDEHNQSQVRTSSIMEIGGGISLRPKEFTVVKRAGSSKLTELKRQSRSMITATNSLTPKGSWVKSINRKGGNDNYKVSIRVVPRVVNTVTSASKNKSEWIIDRYGQYWLSKDEQSYNWRDQFTTDKKVQYERLYDQNKGTLYLVERSGSNLKQIMGKWVAKTRIVLTKVTEQNVADPGTPPFWFRIE